MLEFPWLWMGLRWGAPQARNIVQTSTVLNEASRQIEPHLAPLFLARTEREAAKSAIENLASLFLKLVPGGDLVNEMRSGGKTLRELFKNLKAMRGAKSGTSTSPAERHELAERNVQSRTTDLLELFLDPTEHDLPTVPVVLVLDDAQWIGGDRQALEFLADLWSKAKENGWPLLIMANHYEKEWREFDNKKVLAVGRAHLRACFESDSGGDTSDISTFFLKRIGIGHCEKIVWTCFPGLSEEQVAYIVSRASANLRFQIELLSYLREQPYLFINEDTHGSLTEYGFEKLKSETTDWQRFTRTRLAALDRDIRAALCICGIQGMRFVDELAGLVVEEFRNGSGADLTNLSLPEAVPYCVDRAENPHALISLQPMDELELVEPATKTPFRRRCIGEFRHPEYREVLQQMIPEVDRQAIQSTTATVLLREWDAGRLPINRAIVWELLIAHVVCDPTTEAEARLRARVLVDSLMHFHGWADFWAARRTSTELMDVVRQFGLPASELTEPQTLCHIARHLRDAKAFEEARALAAEMVDYYQQRLLSASESGLANLQRNLSVWCEQYGDAEMGLGNPLTALKYYQKSHKNAASTAVKNREKELQQLSDLATSFEKVGDALIALGDYQSALEARSSCLTTRVTIVRRYDESLQPTVSLLAAFYRLGDCHLAMEKI